MEKIKLGEMFRGLEPPKRPEPPGMPVVEESGYVEPTWQTECSTCSVGRVPSILIKASSGGMLQICQECWDTNPAWNRSCKVLFRKSVTTPDAVLKPCSYPTHRHNRPRKAPCGVVDRRTGKVCTRGQFHANEHHAMNYATGRCEGEWP